MAYRPYQWRKNNPEKRREQKKRAKVRNELRSRNILPPYGEPLNETQQKIWDDISNNDFTYWDKIKANCGESFKITSENHYKYKRKEIRNALRKKGILPKYGEPLNEEQQKIWDDISNNDFTYWDRIKYDGTYNPNPNDLKVKIRENEYLLWYRAKDSAKNRKLDFNLDIEDIVIPEVCPYLKVPLLTDVESHNNPHYYSIDRIDSTKGYVKGNIQIISRLANTMKNNSTLNELTTFAKNVLERHTTT